MNKLTKARVATCDQQNPLIREMRYCASRRHVLKQCTRAAAIVKLATINAAMALLGYEFVMQFNNQYFKAATRADELNSS